MLPNQVDYEERKKANIFCVILNCENCHNREKCEKKMETVIKNIAVELRKHEGQKTL